jgi:hypothetical protein
MEYTASIFRVKELNVEPYIFAKLFILLLVNGQYMERRSVEINFDLTEIKRRNRKNVPSLKSCSHTGYGPLFADSASPDFSPPLCGSLKPIISSNFSCLVNGHFKDPRFFRVKESSPRTIFHTK